MDVFGQMLGGMLAALVGTWLFGKKLEQERGRKVPDRDVWGWPWESWLRRLWERPPTNKLRR